ncbi:MAG TPA: hypothetical protein VHT96_15755 [Clostridia bacterium]|nr:hypothetical protein [Clostridia bacterium]
MRKFMCAVILVILVPAVMFILNSAVLRLFFGIDASDQLNALMSLVVAGNIPGTEAAVPEGGGGLQYKAGGLKNTGGGVENTAGGLKNKAEDRQAKGGIPYPDDAVQTSVQGSERSAVNPAQATPGLDGAGADVTGDDYFLTHDEIELLRNISLQDKLNAIRILSVVDREVLDSAVKMAGDGITYDEYEALKESSQAFLDPIDIKTLEDILDRNKSLYAQGGG